MNEEEIRKAHKYVKHCYIGERYGTLTVVDEIRERGVKTKAVCLCDCGNTITTFTNNLVSGMTTNCGCQKGQKHIRSVVGKRFGKLVVIEDYPVRKGGNKRVLCKCDCGNTCMTTQCSLVTGVKTHCGCESKLHHGKGTRLYRIWGGMKTRCFNKNDKNYDGYGGRGITVCEDWSEFVPFRDWALNNGYLDDLSIDRKDNDGNYCPENCRWATPLEQSNNQRSNRNLTFEGKTMTCAQWSRYRGWRKELVSRRLASGWSVERALTEPCHTKGENHG